MALVSTAGLVRDAVAAGSAVPAFNVITLEHSEAILAGAEAAGVGVILQVSQNAVRFHGGRLLPLARAVAAMAEAVPGPAALHLDHVEDLELLRQALGAGFSSVMFDAGHLPYAENVRLTRDAAGWARDAGLWLEAELGHVGGKPGGSAHDPGVRTDPGEAARFVAATGVDALAVAVGSSHAMTTRSAHLDIELIGVLAARVPVPLALHGSSGVLDAQLAAAVAAGIRKVNIGTALNVAMTAAVRGALSADPTLVDPRRYLAAGRTAIADAVRHLASVVDGRSGTCPTSARPRS
jgi:fructose-bisphosphate aldolase class II